MYDGISKGPGVAGIAKFSGSNSSPAQAAEVTLQRCYALQQSLFQILISSFIGENLLQVAETPST